jgi:hypothetical protein
VVVQDLADTLCARLREAELRDTRTDSLDNGGLGDDGDADDGHDHYDPNVPDWVTLSVEIRPEQRRAEREQQPDPIPDVSIPRHGVTSIS